MDLLSSLPSGRDIHSPPGPYKLPSLEEEELVRMRAPPGEDDFGPASDVDDSDEETTSAIPTRDLPSAVSEQSKSAYY